MPRIKVRTVGHRLASMSAGEIGDRLAQAVRREAIRFRLRLGMAGISDAAFLRAIDAENGRSPESTEEVWRLWLDGTRRRWFLMPDQIALFKTEVERQFPSEGKAVIDMADEILSGKARIFGRELTLSLPHDWHRGAPETPRWPRRFWGDISVLDPRFPDPKWVWEVNRHSFLLPLALASWLTGRSEYMRRAFEWIHDWTQDNPPGIGVNWAESLEQSLRVLNWMWVLHTLPLYHVPEPKQFVDVLKSLLAQIRHIRSFPSTYTSPNTHLLAEATALYLVGGALPLFREAEGWMREGRRLLESEILKQVHPDGSYREESTYYHAYAVDLYLLVASFAQRWGPPLSPDVEERLRRMVDYLRWTRQPDGRLFPLGDADGGRVLGLLDPSYERCDGLLRRAAALFPDGDVAVDGGGGIEALLTCGLSLERSTPPRENKGGRIEIRQAAGGTVARSGWDRKADWLILCGGELGMLSGGHAHADALSIGLAVSGRPIFVDPGTYAYKTDRRWRDHFRSASAHNTVSLDGRESASPGDLFRWRERIPVINRKSVAVDDVALLAGSHSGFESLPGAPIHERSVVWLRPYGWFLIDRFLGSGDHDITWRFQLHPDCEIIPEGNDVRISIPDAGIVVRMISLSGGKSTMEVNRGSEEPIAGWYSSLYGTRVPAPLLTITDHVAAPLTRCWAILPERAMILPDTVERSGRGADVSASFRHSAGGVVGLVARTAPSAPWLVNGIEEMTARLALWETDSGGQLSRLFVVDGDRFVGFGTEIQSESPWEFVYITRHPVGRSLHARGSGRLDIRSDEGAWSMRFADRQLNMLLRVGDG